MRLDVERTALDGQAGGGLFGVFGVDGFDQTSDHIVSLKPVQHARRWRPYRAIALETNSDEYPWEGICVPGESKSRYEKGMEFVQGSLRKQVVLCLQSRSEESI